MDKLYSHRPIIHGGRHFLRAVRSQSPNAKTTVRLRTCELKSDAFSLFFSQSYSHIRSVEMEREAVSATHGISSEISISHLF
jgi:hypothetical protein